MVISKSDRQFQNSGVSIPDDFEFSVTSLVPVKLNLVLLPCSVSFFHKSDTEIYTVR